MVTLGYSTDTIVCLLFRLGSEEFALPGTVVREVLRWRDPTPVPSAPTLLPGIITQRGGVLTVVDLRRLLSFAAPPPTRLTRYVVVSHDGLELALIADAVVDLLELPASILEVLPPAFNPQRAQLLQAIANRGGRPIALLDPAELVTTLRAEAQA
ncbi:MAG: chemotaxis protein CheW [Chloroflexaceae bacterium]|nr:chemotaxis protein CheW [Chloroflexaceae bacterium]NJO04162.1 chemotaxis protein CheW [Chloroflexaceae bacterium]